jgi:hypothetical protein
VESHTLIAMRLADMHKVHPNQDNSRVCARCGHQVGLYPSGQAIMRRHPDTIIVCQMCHMPDVSAKPAGGIETVIQEAKDSVPAKPRRH